MMADNPIAQVKHLPPKQLAIIAGVGIVAGLYLRKRAKSKTSNAPAALVAAVPDTGLASSSTGPYAGSTGGTTGGTSTDNLATRDTGGNTISLPVQSWIIGGPGGTQYVTDGKNLTPYNPNGSTSTVAIPSAPPPVDSNQPMIQSTGPYVSPVPVPVWNGSTSYQDSVATMPTNTTPTDVTPPYVNPFVWNGSAV